MTCCFTCAEGILVLVQKSVAAVGDGPSIMLHNEVIGWLLWVIPKVSIAVQILPQLGTEGAVCSLCISATYITHSLLHAVCNY